MGKPWLTWQRTNGNLQRLFFPHCCCYLQILLPLFSQNFFLSFSGFPDQSKQCGLLFWSVWLPRLRRLLWPEQAHSARRTCALESGEGRGERLGCCCEDPSLHCSYWGLVGRGRGAAQRPGRHGQPPVTVRGPDVSGGELRRTCSAETRPAQGGASFRSPGS